MRAIWKGSITFGLVSIPVKLYPATEKRDLAFHQVRRSDGARIRHKRVAAVDGEEVPYADIAKGYELPGGEIVVLTEEDFAGLPQNTSRAIDVLEFVPFGQIDPIYFTKSYYLEPDRTGAKPYALLREALERANRVAIVKFALRARDQLGMVRVRDGVFVLDVMRWPDEVHTPDFGFLDEQVEVRPQDLAMTESLIATLAADFDPSRYRDSYREALLAVIDAKATGKDVVSSPAGGGEPPTAVPAPPPTPAPAGGEAASGATADAAAASAGPAESATGAADTAYADTADAGDGVK